MYSSIIGLNYAIIVCLSGVHILVMLINTIKCTPTPYDDNMTLLALEAKCDSLTAAVLMHSVVHHDLQGARPSLSFKKELTNLK